MWVCLCFNLKETDVLNLIEEKGLKAIVSRAQKKGCGTCIEAITELKKLKSSGDKIGLRKFSGRNRKISKRKK